MLSRVYVTVERPSVRPSVWYMSPKVSYNRKQAFQSTQRLFSCASDSAFAVVLRAYKLHLLTYLILGYDDTASSKINVADHLQSRFRHASRLEPVPERWSYVHNVAAVDGSEVGQEVEIAESGQFGVDPQIVGDLFHALEYSQLARSHSRNAPV